MSPPDRFDTPRLHLRPVRCEDALPIFRTYAGEEEPTRYMNFARHRRPAESEVFANRCALCWDIGSAFPFAIVERVSGTFIGLVEVRLRPPKADFGYILGAKFWGRGYATEAATAIADWTIEQPSIFRIWATCHPDNIASAKVLVKAGLAWEATLSNWESRPQLGEAAGPSLLFARLKPSLPTVRRDDMDVP